MGNSHLNTPVRDRTGANLGRDGKLKVKAADCQQDKAATDKNPPSKFRQKAIPSSSQPTAVMKEPKGRMSSGINPAADAAANKNSSGFSSAKSISRLEQQRQHPNPIDANGQPMGANGAKSRFAIAAIGVELPPLVEPSGNVGSSEKPSRVASFEATAAINGPEAGQDANDKGGSKKRRRDDNDLAEHDCTGAIGGSCGEIRASSHAKHEQLAGSDTKAMKLNSEGDHEGSPISFPQISSRGCPNQGEAEPKRAARESPQAARTSGQCKIEGPLAEESLGAANRTAPICVDGLPQLSAQEQRQRVRDWLESLDPPRPSGSSSGVELQPGSMIEQQHHRQGQQHQQQPEWTGEDKQVAVDDSGCRDKQEDRSSCNDSCRTNSQPLTGRQINWDQHSASQLVSTLSTTQPADKASGPSSQPTKLVTVASQSAAPISTITGDNIKLALHDYNNNDKHGGAGDGADIQARTGPPADPQDDLVGEANGVDRADNKQQLLAELERASELSIGCETLAPDDIGDIVDEEWLPGEVPIVGEAEERASDQQSLDSLSNMADQSSGTDLAKIKQHQSDTERTFCALCHQLGQVAGNKQGTRVVGAERRLHMEKEERNSCRQDEARDLYCDRVSSFKTVEPRKLRNLKEQQDAGDAADARGITDDYEYEIQSDLLIRRLVDDEDEDEDEYDNDVSFASVVDNSSRTRPISAQSKLCPIVAAGPQPSAVKTQSSPKQVTRGLSLDGNHRHIGPASKESGSRPTLSTRSPSGKLIIINSNNNSAYTIQVALPSQDEPSQLQSSATEREEEANKGPCNHHKQEHSSAINKYKQEDSESIKQSGTKSEKSSATHQSNRIDSCKKFLVKKISCSSPRAFIRKQRQLITKEDSQGSEELSASSQQTEEQKLTGKATQINRAKTTSFSGLSRLQTKRSSGKTRHKTDSKSITMALENNNPSCGRMAHNNDPSLAESLVSNRADSEIDHKVLIETAKPNWQASQAAELSLTECPLGEDALKSCNIAAKRLRELVAHLEHGSVPQSVLYQTIEYAASVLDSVTMDQISRLSDEDEGDLSEVQSDAVPNEVRKWLETTFTRNSISQKRKSDDKLKFRSVANAIRAGIVVDRIYRRMSASTPFVSPEVSELLKSIDSWSFDCFYVNQISNGQVLKSVGYELFNRYGLMYKFKIPTNVLKNFLTQVELGYVKHKNPYHNNLHAADVTQTVHYMLWQAGLTQWLTDLEIFATLLAAIIHDYLHTGTTNNFHVMSQSETALIYNDRAVLENFHICQAFSLMKNEDCNILAGLSKDEYREFRSLVIDMVLATDMSSHFQQIKAMKNILNHSDNFNSDKSKILSLVIHISDISHPAKDWEIHSQWTQLLMEEFFRQGDREKELGLECSPLCDRETTLVAESQLGFIEFIVSPSLEVCGDVLDRVHYNMAEANARPVLPVSAKPAITGSPKTVRQVEPAPALNERPASAKVPSNQQQAVSSSTSAVAGSSSRQAASSETLASNLRKIIVSSSASIGRRLNISTSSADPTKEAQSKDSDKQAIAASDFETRQANYKHPVIRCEKPSASSRPKSALSRVRCDSTETDASVLDINSEQNSTAYLEAGESELSNCPPATDSGAAGTLAVQSTSLVPNSLVARLSQSGDLSNRSHSAPQLHLLKIHRPWLACLERNKKMWQERAIVDAKARELKEKLKQEQIVASGDLEEVQ